MKIHASLLVVPLLVSAAFVHGQARQHDPVPVRIAVEHYGAVSTGPNVPVARVELNLEHPLGPRIEVQGGMSHEAALLLVGTARADLQLPSGISLHVDPASAVMVAGSFDQGDVFAVPIDPTLPALRGGRLCVQGVRIHAGPGGSKLFLSDGMQLDFVPGNVQPQLGYDGPTLVATPVRERIGNDALVRLRIDVASPVPGSVLVFGSPSSHVGITTVELTLLEPASATGTATGLFGTLDLGVALDPRIDVVVRRATLGSSVGGPALLAARIALTY